MDLSRGLGDVYKRQIVMLPTPVIACSSRVPRFVFVVLPQFAACSPFPISSSRRAGEKVLGIYPTSARDGVGNSQRVAAQDAARTGKVRRREERAGRATLGVVGGDEAPTNRRRAVDAERRRGG
jgi:hypothetical protein